MAKPKTPKPVTALDLAKEVVKLITLKKLKPTTGIYLDLGKANFNRFAGGSLQKALQAPAFKNCEACGIGGFFLAYVDKKNEVEIPPKIQEEFGYNRENISTCMNDDDDMVEKMEGIISERQLRLIECAFECTNVNDAVYDDIAEAAARAFGKQYSSATKRMLAIAENLIDHKGKFCPSITVDWYD